MAETEARVASVGRRRREAGAERSARARPEATENWRSERSADITAKQAEDGRKEVERKNSAKRRTQISCLSAPLAPNNRFWTERGQLRKSRNIFHFLFFLDDLQW